MLVITWLKDDWFKRTRVSSCNIDWYNIVKDKDDDYYMEMVWQKYIYIWSWKINNRLFEKTQNQWINDYIEEQRKNFCDKIWKDIINIYNLYLCWFSELTINDAIISNRKYIEKVKEQRLNAEFERKKEREEFDRQYKEKINNEIELFEDCVVNKKEYELKNKDTIIALFKKYNIDIPLKTHWFINEKLNYINSEMNYSYKSNRSSWSKALSQMLRDVKQLILNPIH